MYRIPLKDMGLEYNDEKLTDSYLYEKLQKKSIPIKTSLLDQSIITGIGNIYDDEILFMSKINPKRKSSTITKKECQKIIDNTIIVLEKAIKSKALERHLEIEIPDSVYEELRNIIEK